MGHAGNVKCVDFVGDDGKWIVSGSSDNTVRIWDVSSMKSGGRVASASGDGTVKVLHVTPT